MSEDTIAAIATPPGEGGVAIVRLSGPRAVAIVAGLAGANIERAPSHTAHHAWLHDPSGRTLDEAVVTVFRAPRSYTGEDVVEIGVHGGGVLARRVLRFALEGGARLADRGEFTRRAFLGGRIDLSQAEAVAELVGARTERGADAALRALGGGLAARTLRIESDLIDLVARLETNLDFTEDVAPADRDAISRALDRCEEDLERLERNAVWARRLREGAAVALVGRPNVGKSSLFNALVQDERAIVNEAPGTTRDWLEAWLDIGGIPVRLIDTAGWRECAEGVEAEGVRRARQVEERADVRIIVIAANEGATPQDLEIRNEIGRRGAPAILVENKCDLVESHGTDGLRFTPELRVSARTGEGIEALRDAICRRLQPAGAIDPNEEFLAGERHEEAIRRARGAVRTAAVAWASGNTEELIAGDLRGAAAAIGEITGKSVGEEVLDRIFARFCIGK